MTHWWFGRMRLASQIMSSEKKKSEEIKRPFFVGQRLARLTTFLSNRELQGACGDEDAHGAPASCQQGAPVLKTRAFLLSTEIG